MQKDYRGPWSQACELVRNFQNTINAAIIDFNRASGKVISSINLFSSEADFIADIKGVVDQLGSKGMNAERLNEGLNEIKNLLKRFLDGIGELDIHIISGAFICPSLMSLRPSVDFFKVWSIDVDTFINSSSTTSIETKPRSVSSYTDLMTSNYYLAAYYKVILIRPSSIIIILFTLYHNID